MRILVLIVSSILLTRAIQGQEEVIPLWTGEMPIAGEDEGEKRPTLHLYPVENGNGAGVIICPGGGYRGLATDHEGHQVARWYNRRGVAAFVLHYRLGSQAYHYPAQLCDVQRAIRMVRAKAPAWRVDPERIGVMGFSAGGHLASMAATLFDEKVYEAIDDSDSVSARPDFAVLCYPVISMDSEVTHSGSRKSLLGPERSDDDELARFLSTDQRVSKKTPPTFLFHTDEDKAVRPENSIRFYLGLKEHGIPAELHLFQNGPHGVGLFEGDPILGTWSNHLEDWLRSNGFFSDKAERAAVSGTVKIKGEPVSWGTVTFRSPDPNQPVVTIRVRRGRFSAGSETGPVKGPATVSFSGSIWESTGDAADGVISVDEGPEIEVKEGAKFEWDFDQ